MSINSKLLLNSDNNTLEKLLGQLKIDPKTLIEMIRNIQEWYKREHSCKEDLHDQLITRFLIMRKCNVERVKENLINYFSMKHEMEDILCNRDPSESKLNSYLKTGYWIVLPKKTPENHRVTIFSYIIACKGNKLKKSRLLYRTCLLNIFYGIKSSIGVSIVELIKVVFMIAEYRLWNDSVMGEQCILDFENVTLQLAVQLTPALISKIVFYVTSCIGPKLKGLHLIHLPFYATAAFELFKKLMKPKLVARIHVYKKIEEVMEIFPKNIFPKDLGGSDDVSCQEIADAWLETFSSHGWREHFNTQDNLRIEKIKNNDKELNDNFGVQGSFKKLNLD